MAAGPREYVVEDRAPLRNGLFDQRKDQVVDDLLARPLTRHDRLTKVGTGLVDDGERGSLPAPRQFDARGGESEVCKVSCSSL